MQIDEVTIGAAGLFLAGLTYFAGIQRGKAAQRRSEKHAERMRDEAWEREDDLRRNAESAQRVSKVVELVQHFLTPAGGAHGTHLETLQEAGIRALSDAEIRGAMKQIAQRTRIALPEEEWAQIDDVDLKKLFTSVYGRVNLSGGRPTLVGIVRSLRADGVDIKRIRP